MKNSFVFLLLLVVTGFEMAGCSTVHEAVFGRKNKLAPLSSVTLGSTSRDEIIEKFGTPEEINKRWFESHDSEVYFYLDKYHTNNGEIEYQFLACEFTKGMLTAYAFHESSEPTQTSFDDKDRSKLIKGKSTRHDVENLLGLPVGRALLPTTITVPALALKLGGAPFPLTRIPEDAREVWQYYSQNFDDYLNKSAQKTLSVFFDAKGLFIGSALLQELSSKAP